MSETTPFSCVGTWTQLYFFDFDWLHKEEGNRHYGIEERAVPFDVWRYT